MGTKAPGTIHISIDDLRQHRPYPPSASVSDEDEDGVHVSPQGPSPDYSIVQPPDSHSEPSSHSGDGGFFPVPLSYPAEIQESEGDPEAHPYTSTNRPPHRQRHASDTSRSSSIQREGARRIVQLQAPYRVRRMPPSESVADEAESTEVFLQGPEYAVRMPRGQSYHGQPGYTHSSSSDSYTYPQVPQHSHQIVTYAPPPPPQTIHPYGPPPPVPYGYPPQQPLYREPPPHAYPPHIQPPPPPNMSPLYGHAAVHQYPPGYFQSYGQYSQNPYYMPQFQGIPPQMPPYMQYPPLSQHDSSRAAVTSPAPAAAAAAAPPQIASPPPITLDENAMMEKFQALLLAERADRAKVEADRQKEIQSAEQRLAAMHAAERERREEEKRIRAEALKAAEEEAITQRKRDVERRAEEARIREEARKEALEAEKARIAAEIEKAAYEAKIRKEAADAALAAAAAEAKAKQEQADREAKIAADAAEAAKSAANKEAKLAAEAAEKAAKEASEAAEAASKAAKAEAAAKEKAAAEAAAAAKKEHEAKLKEAEAAAEAAKKEAEAAEAKAAGLVRSEKKPPLKFKDALGRNFNFPWDRCCKWDDMEALINQAFAHIENIGPHVKQGHYDLIGPDKEIIMADYWEDSITPGMQIHMMLWPIPEPPPAGPEPFPPPLDPLLGFPPPLGDDIIDIEAILANAKKPQKNKSNSSKKKPSGGLASWMLGGTSGARAKPSSKDSKKPELVVVSRHGATEAGACTVM